MSTQAWVSAESSYAAHSPRALLGAHVPTSERDVKHARAWPLVDTRSRSRSGANTPKDTRVRQYTCVHCNRFSFLKTRAYNVVCSLELVQSLDHSLAGKITSLNDGVSGLVSLPGTAPPSPDHGRALFDAPLCPLFCRPGVRLSNAPAAGVDGTDGEHPLFTRVLNCSARE
eukprot:1581961-Pleurochrysis_carterae.AAC.1